MQQQIASCWYNVTESECCNAATDCNVLVQRDWEWVLQCYNRLHRAGTTWLRVSAAMLQQIASCWYNVTKSECCNAATDCNVLVQRDWEWVLQCSNRLHRAGITWLRVSAAMQQQIATCWYNVTESECCIATTDCIVLVQRDWEWVLQCYNRLHRAGTTWLRVSAAMQHKPRKYNNALGVVIIAIVMFIYDSSIECLHYQVKRFTLVEIENTRGIMMLTICKNRLEL